MIRDAPVPTSAVQNLDERREPFHGGVSQLDMRVSPAGSIRRGNWSELQPIDLLDQLRNLVKLQSSMISSRGTGARPRIPRSCWRSGLETPRVFCE